MGQTKNICFTLGRRSRVRRSLIPSAIPVDGMQVNAIPAAQNAVFLSNIS
jgi:hypothetical protein